MSRSNQGHFYGQMFLCGWFAFESNAFLFKNVFGGHMHISYFRLIGIPVLGDLSSGFQCQSGLVVLQKIFLMYL